MGCPMSLAMREKGNNMSKKPKKWTKWIEHTGKHCPVDVYEFVKVDFNNPCDYLKKMSAGKFYWGGDQLYTITHYKRLLSNVEAERVARIKNEIDWKIVEENAAWEDAEPDIHESARHDPDARASEFEEICGQVREAEEFRTSKPSTKFDDPKPIITGIGRYKTAGNRLVRIYGYYPGDGSTAQGNVYLNGSVEFYECWWKLNGASLGGPKTGEDFNIIGFWGEPKTEKPEQWTAVYRSGKQQLWIGGRKEDSADKVHQSNTQTANYCGALKLSHTEE